MQKTQESTKIFLILKSYKHCKMQGKIQRSVAIIYSSNELLELEIKQLLFTVSQKN